MMVKSTVYIFSVLMAGVVFGRPDPLGTCYSLKCPEETTMCGKHSEVSENDRTKLSVQIRCYDSEGNILKSKNLTEENPFGENVYYKGTKFAAVLRLPDFETVNPEDTDHEKEFNRIPSSTAKSGPKSEIEDLNNY